MLLCFVNAGFGWNVSVVGAATDCASGFVAQSAAAFVPNTGGGAGGSLDITALSSLFKLYFEFDAVLSSQIIGWYLFSFVSGHALGRVMRTWAKSF
ncbi:MAG: hypothetical protein QX194_06070 [Methylococcales bacterium]